MPKASKFWLLYIGYGCIKIGLTYTDATRGMNKAKNDAKQSPAANDANSVGKIQTDESQNTKEGQLDRFRYLNSCDSQIIRVLQKHPDVEHDKHEDAQK